MGHGRAAGAFLAIALVGSGLGVAGDVVPAGAKPKPVITATGNVSCQGSGKMKAAAGWTGSTFFAAAAAKLTIGCTGSTGNPAVTVKKGKAIATWSSSGANSCALSGAWRVAIGWKGNGGKINPTSMTYSNSQVTGSGWSFPGSGGTATVTGSWASTGESAGSISGPSQSFKSLCQAGPPSSPTKPTKSVTFASVAFNL
jgi:hypothetical protein